MMDAAAAVPGFLRAHRDEILERWAEFVRADPLEARLDETSLIDHLPAILEHVSELASALERGTEDGREAPEAQHALERLDRGFGLSHVIRELSALRTTILMLWEKELRGALSIKQVRLLNEALDRAIAISAEQFMEARNRTLTAVDRVATAAFSSRSTEELLQRLITVLMETTPSVDSVAILLREGPGDELVVRAAVGLEEDLVDRYRLRIGEGFAGTVASARRPMELRAAANDPLLRSPVLRRANVRALYGLPLIESERLLGVFHVGSLTAWQFSAQDRHLFETIAARISEVLVHAFLRDEANRRAAELDAVIEAIPDGVYIAGPRGVTRVNTAGARLLGARDPEDAIGRIDELSRALDTRDATTGAKLTEDEPMVMALRGVPATREVVYRRLDTGKEIFVRSAAAPILVGGQVSGAVAVNTDITEARHAAEERTRLLAALERAVVLRERVLQTVSHDLKNPISTIVTTAALQAQRAPFDESGRRLRSDAERILRAANRMNRLVHDLLDAATIAAGTLRLQFGAVDPADVVTEAADEWRGTAEEIFVTLRLEIAAGLPAVSADRDRLLQVLGNLLSNALKVSSNGQEILLTASQPASAPHVRFTVEDRGPGVAPADRVRIFERFYRAESAGYGAGTGLGLAIAHGIVQAHGGTIGVEPRDGGGSRFYFTIPVAR